MTGMHENFAEIDPDHVTITNPISGPSKQMTTTSRASLHATLSLP